MDMNDMLVSNIQNVASFAFPEAKYTYRNNNNNNNNNNWVQ